LYLIIGTSRENIASNTQKKIHKCAIMTQSSHKSPKNEREGGQSKMEKSIKNLRKIKIR